MDQESILNLIQTAKDTYGVPPSMVSILRVLNKLVAMDDYDTATEGEQVFAVRIMCVR